MVPQHVGPGGWLKCLIFSIWIKQNFCWLYKTSFTVHPIQNLLRKARKEGLIQNDWFAHVLIKEVNFFPHMQGGNLSQVDSMANLNGMLICYGWINIPLVYTQVQFFLFFIFGFYFHTGGHFSYVCLLCCLSLWSPIPASNTVQSGRRQICAGRISPQKISWFILKCSF